MKKESTMKVQREMELSEYNRKGILKSVSRQKPSVAFKEYCKKRNCKSRSVQTNKDCYTCRYRGECRDKWYDKHCTYNGASRKARRMK